MLGLYNLDSWTSCPVSEIDEKLLKQKRAGIIVYTFQPATGTSPRGERDIDQQFKLVFGEDSDHEEFTDLAGQVQSGENPIQAAIREFQEESQRVFGYLRVKDLRNCIAIFSVDLLIIFVRLIFNRRVIAEAFKKRVAKAEAPEVSRLFLLTLEDVQKAINDEYSRKLYYPVKMMLSKIPNLEEFALTLP
uniref:NUDIX hydrolase n=1 Tax=Pithovirus LCPAC103 TaxID=2506588 RepID=A0A481Z5H7_9VIRU|nr:MAG: NUDIX hydrolase [Pithovirus LCPAC103]